jgi:hypothetical protein
MLLVRKKASFHSLLITSDKLRGVSQASSVLYLSNKGLGQYLSSTIGQAKLFVQ